MPKNSKTKRLVKKAFHEVKENPPSTLKKQSKSKMRKQEVAIALSKARKKGARVPKK